MKLFNHLSLFIALALVIRAHSRLNIPNNVNLPSVRDDVAHNDLVPRDDIYDQAVARGQAFLVQLSSNQYSAPITGGTVADSGFQGWRISPIPRATIDDTLSVVLQDLVGTPRNEYYAWRATITYQNKGASYRNLFGPKDGIIAALYNFNGGLKMPMSNWSEISWRIWAETCESHSIDPKTLKYIIRHKIVNSETIDIIKHIYRTEFPNQAVGSRIVLFPGGSTLQAFQALLGSPNGRGVAWMVLNKRNVLEKTIAKITVEWVSRDTVDMWFELQERAVAPSSGTVE